ncbi:ABC transporter ATP-binding protein [Rhizorhabdus dicambivorans]|nr:ABC transporter ATP-binding protein [Rhizorhabdus dicambivorans]
MAFQPFGFSFHIATSKSPTETKVAIQSRTKRWFDPKNGARGWIAGPLICLWLSAFDNHGPMLFGWVSKSEKGCTIRGRAGADLNGVVMAALILLPTIWIMFKIASNSDGFWPLLIVASLSFPLIFWMAHKDRRQGEPLVRFLQDVTAEKSSSVLSTVAAVRISPTLKLSVGGEEVAGPVTPGGLHQALLDAGEGDFIILHSAPERYIQTMAKDGRFFIEKRDGGHMQHFQALRVGVGDKSSERLFSFDEMLSVLVAYASDQAKPSFISWQRLDMPSS